MDGLRTVQRKDIQPSAIHTSSMQLTDSLGPPATSASACSSLTRPRIWGRLGRFGLAILA